MPLNNLDVARDVTAEEHSIKEKPLLLLLNLPKMIWVFLLGSSSLYLFL